jgi:NADPH-ferrihemoprotein reductase
LYPGGHLAVYFGSQTGTAESFANQLQREGQEHGFMVHVLDLQDVEASNDFLNDKLKQDGINKAVYLISTYGEGEPTDNSVSVVMDLKSRLNVVGDEEKKEDFPMDPSFSGLHYCVFGLGNRQYEHFNAMGKFFDSSLEKVGAKRIAILGIGDDDNDLEGDFENWKDNVLWPTLKNEYLKDVVVRKVVQDSPLPETPYVIEYVAKESKMAEMISEVQPDEKMHSSSRHYFTSVDCPTTVVRELRNAQDGGSTVHIEIDTSRAKDFTYKTADNLGVLAANRGEIVTAVAKALKYDLDAMFTVKAAPNHEWHGHPFPQPLTVRECLERYCDLTSPPRRSDLKLLAGYALDPVDRKALLRLASKEGKAEYKDKITNAQVGLVDLLKLCPSINAPLDHFIHFCPRLQPRFYTISSSSSVHPKSVHLTVAVVQTTKKDGSIYKGICSGHLAGQVPGVSICRIFCRDSTFRLPKDTSRPIIMIGPGTGIAPMRALLQERAYQRDVLQKFMGSNILYFGCKKRGLDYLYEDELMEFKKAHVLTELHVAFSRESIPKVYVQHLLEKRMAETWDLMNKQGAYIYVCGGVKMGQDVLYTLKNICIWKGQMSADDAKAYLDKLASEGRFVQELWA